MGALTFEYQGVDLVVAVDAGIYSVNNNIGVLNEDAVFDISIENYVNSSRTINLVIDAGQQVLLNETVVIEALSSKNLTVTQRLIFLGLWTIKFYEDKEISDIQQFSSDKEIVGGYSFVTVVNEAEADMRITQLNNIKLNTNLSIFAIFISILSVVVSAVHVMYARKQYMRDSKTRDKKRESAPAQKLKSLQRKSKKT